MSTRINLCLALAVALVAARLSEAQETSGAQAPREAAEQSDQSDQQQANQRDQQSIRRQSASDQADPVGQERRAGYRGQTARSAIEGQTMRLSEIMDMEVRNAQDENLGEIEDVVIAVDTGEIRYAAVSVGGFLDIGDRLIAVPWRALKIRQSPEDQDEKYVFLNADRARIENAPGFNEENWPDFGNPRYGQEVETYYGTDREQLDRTGTDRSTERGTQFRSSRDTAPRQGTPSQRDANRQQSQDRLDTDVDVDADADSGT